jgi:hypothetical protein
MTIAARPMVQRSRLRLAIAFALVLAALSVAGAIRADQAAAAAHYPSCWTQGHYIHAPQPNSWNNTIGHKVVCDRDIDVAAEFWRYNRSTRVWTLARTYCWNSANYSNGSWINAVNPAVYAPVYSGSSYMLRLYVRGNNGGPWAPYPYDGPLVPY